MGDAKGMMDMLKGVMDMLKQAMQKQGGGGGSGSGSTPPATTPAQTSCAQYYQVTVPSSDPCAYYVPPTSASLLNTNTTQNNASDQLLNALNNSSSLNSSLGGSDNTNTNISDLLLNQNTNTNTNTTQNTTSTPDNTGGTQPPASNLNGGNAVSLQPGAHGNIEVSGTGATVVANARDIAGNTEVAGFYGSDTSGGQPQSAVASMCQTRPWASSIVSFIIPPTFFDGLCSWQGYQVGVPQPAAPATVILQQNLPKPVAPHPQPVVQQGPVVPPQADIWAVPASVPLGSRTSIFWNTKGVASCTETSPDGSFNESTLSGGASTVPLSGATTFTISCLTPDGKPITNYVTVHLSI